jgi:molybdopterin-guanine dinucleotide biosynthesis protein A
MKMREETVPGREFPVGVVLAGGKSWRLGQDKAAVRLGETNLLAHAAALAREVTGRVLVVGRESAFFPSLIDEKPGLGPAGGIVSALRHLGEACLVLSCDLPLMDAGTLRRLLAARAKQKKPETLATAWRNRENGLWEPLATVYEPAFLPLLDAGLASGEKKISRLLPPERINYLEYSAAEALPFFNLNRPADLALLRLYLELAGTERIS